MRRLTITVATLTAGGLVLTAWDPRGIAELPAASAAAPPAITMPRRNSNTTAAVARRTSTQEHAAVARKYRYLLADLPAHTADRELIFGLLVEQESLPPSVTLEGEPAGLDAATTRRLADIDARIRLSLPPESLTQFELYRDSDVEQFHLEEFSEGLREYAPLGATQQRALLDAKLRQKLVFTQLLGEAGLARPSLSLAERAHAMSLIERGLRDYRENYLADIAPLLDPRQATALASFEATEFQGELERLQRIVNSR
jgi:hypothetical protein